MPGDFFLGPPVATSVRISSGPIEIFGSARSLQYGTDFDVRGTVTSFRLVPEPGSLMLLGVGVVGLGIGARRRRPRRHTGPIAREIGANTPWRDSDVRGDNGVIAGVWAKFGCHDPSRTPGAFGANNMFAVAGLEEVLPLAALFPGDTFVFAGSASWSPRSRRSCCRGLRYIPNNRVGIVEKLWSPKGSVPEGRIIALNGEAGFQADLLRGGLHFGLWRWQYRIHKVAAGHRAAGQDRLRLRPRRRAAAAQPDARPRRRLQQLPGRPRVPRRRRRPRPTPSPYVGQRGRQRAILREGVYAINLALFVVITEDAVYRLELAGPARAARRWSSWQNELKRDRRLRPGRHRRPDRDARPAQPRAADRRSTASASSRSTTARRSRPGEIIAPAVGTDRDDTNYHNNYQDPEAFLARRRPPRPAVRRR